jgi:hypothetical protein
MPKPTAPLRSLRFCVFLQWSSFLVSIPLFVFLFPEDLEDPEDAQIQGLCYVRGTSGELDDDNSLRTGMRHDSANDVYGMPVEREYKWALELHSLPPSLNPREESILQPVNEQNFCHKGF